MSDVKITTEAHDALNVVIREMRNFKNDESRLHIFAVLGVFFCEHCGREFTDMRPCNCKRDE